jgi:thiol-disulfide isomerase/thioredoxin
MSQSNFFLRLDAFRKIPTELTNPTVHGAYLTLLAYTIMGVLFLLEVYAYFRTNVIQTVELDQYHDEAIYVDFDVSMFDLPCQYTKVSLKSMVGNHEISVAPNLDKKRLMGGTDRYSGAVDQYQEERHRETPADHHAELTGEHPELDADWDSTSDHFKHTDFNAVLHYHDYTMVNFYATWCVHCRRFAPTWKEAEVAADGMTWTNAKGRRTSVKLLRVNCVEFGQLCSEQGVRAYPTVRLYKRDASFSQYRGQREKEPILSFVQDFVSKDDRAPQIESGEASEVVSHHSTLHEGCRISGTMRMQRAPSFLTIEANSGIDSLDPRMTNVSHKVNHVYVVGDRDALRDFVKTASRNLYGDALRNVQPMKEQVFIAAKAHTAPQHFLDVVPTSFSKDVTMYQAAVQSHQVEIPVTEVPQARFQFVFSPLTVKVQSQSRPFYDFMTSLFAIIGGTYTFISLIDKFMDTVSTRFKSQISKLG